MYATQIHLLSTDANERGDLFTRLVRDVVHALGYEEVRSNVARTGREVDLVGKHRLEAGRYIVVECKATAEPVGGDAINKLVGVVDAERQRLQDRRTGRIAVSAYFVSLGGFRDSAREQEAALRRPRATLMDGAAVAAELIYGRIAVSREVALERAGRLLGPESALAPVSADLVVHEQGLAWAVAYGAGGATTHLALVHADGTGLAATAAAPYVTVLRALGHPLGELTLIARRTPPESSEARRAAAVAAYQRYLVAACGEIQLDGLPADEQIGSRRLRLENLFVPLHLRAAPDPPPDASADQGQFEFAMGAAGLGVPARRRARARGARQAVGRVLARHPRLALLAPPGGGKSTLLKRLAVAYGVPGRRSDSADGLPDREWLPLYVRCRDLGPLSREPTLTTLVAVAERASMGAGALVAFSEVVGDALREGRALLLIDGLDEIASDGDRVAFVDQLRTFLATYPAAALVVTSREAGFRAVASALASECARYHLADFDANDVRRLVRAWHREVYGDGAEQQRAADDLSRDVLSVDRIRDLAVNPLLLTTLLLVKRWIGQLPTRRTALYDKAIEVLLATWNVQAHAPIALEEALPRLSYVAHAMLSDGVQRISRTRLGALLAVARADLPDVLGYSTVTDADFIDRVELRSSLLIRSGHALEAGVLTPLYEFRHLTFQEYLAARAVVHGHHAPTGDDDTPVGALRPHLGDARWREVIPMAAVLAGRGAKAIVGALVAAADAHVEAEPREAIGDDVWAEWAGRAGQYGALLRHCLLDEVQIGPGEVDAALRVMLDASGALVYEGVDSPDAAQIRALASGRFGPRLLAALAETGTRVEITSVESMCLASIAAIRAEWAEDDIFALRKLPVERVAVLLSDPEPTARLGAAMLVMEVAYGGGPALHREVASLAEPTARLLDDPLPVVQYAAAWALTWLGERGLAPDDPGAVLLRLSELWDQAQPEHLRRMAAWATCRLPLGPRGEMPLAPLTAEVRDRTVAGRATPHAPDVPAQIRQAALTLAYHYGLGSDAELAADIAATVDLHRGKLDLGVDWAVGLLQRLGEPGAAQLARMTPDAPPVAPSA